MKMMILAAGLVLCCGVAARAEDWGTISGQVVVTGDIPAPVLLHAKGAPGERPCCLCSDGHV